MATASSWSTPRRAASSDGAQNACSMGTCWSSSIPSSNASGSRSSNASAVASWLSESGTWQIMPERAMRKTAAVLPDLSPAVGADLRVAFLRAGYTPDGVRTLLGPAAHAALGRGEPEPAHRAAADGGELGVLVRMLLLGATEPAAAVAAALAPSSP